MIMAVTEQDVAALRAQLAGDFAGHKRLLGQLEETEGFAGYMALVAAGFFEAVDRRFGAGTTPADVIEFVGDIRSRFDGADHEIDPRAAERLILRVLGQGSVTDLDGASIRRLQRLLLPLLVADEQLDGAGLEEFLTRARKLANR
jgi:hypothetical protein